MRRAYKIGPDGKLIEIAELGELQVSDLFCMQEASCHWVINEHTKRCLWRVTDAPRLVANPVRPGFVGDMVWVWGVDCI